MLKNTSHENKPIDTENRLMVITRDGTESGLEAKMGKGQNDIWPLRKPQETQKPAISALHSSPSCLIKIAT